MRAAAVIALVALSACHFHRDSNAPGIVELERPPKQPARQTVEYPDDPGERMVTLSSGALAGGGGRFDSPSHGVFDLAGELTLSLGESPRSHNDNASRLFIPRGLIWPRHSYGVTLGWSALQVLTRSGEDSDIGVGPIYVEAQRAGSFWGVGGGWAVQPTDGDHGPQLNAYLAVAFLRTRYLFDRGFEFTLGYQLKIPTTWVWSR